MKQIKELLNKYQIIESARASIKEYENDISDAKEDIKELFEDIEFHKFVTYALIDSIKKFDLNKDKEDNLYNETTITSSSSDGTYKTKIHKEINSESKFNPLSDKWEFYDIKEENGKYKIGVENIKCRKFLNPFMWEPDIFYTDWIEI